MMLTLPVWIGLSVGVVAAAEYYDPFECSQARQYYNVNGSSTISFPAPKLVNGSVQQDGTAEPWKLTRTARYNPTTYFKVPASFYRLYLDTANTDTTDFNYCAQLILPEGGPGEGYTFTPEVLARSVNDTGDCKIMLGEKCIKALREQSMVSTSRKACPTLDPESIPEACSSVSVWNRRWHDLRSTEIFDKRPSYRPDNITYDKCDPPVQPPSKSVHYLFDSAIGRINAFRAPAIVLLTISRNPLEGSHPNQQVEIFCPRADDFIAPGSEVTPRMDEVMKWSNISFMNTTYNPKTSSAPRVVGNGYGLWSLTAMMIISVLCL